MIAPSNCSSARDFRILSACPRHSMQVHYYRLSGALTCWEFVLERNLPGISFSRADRLAAVGCFSVGTNQVDLNAARQLGIPVFNAPFSNTRSVAELVIGEIVMLLRRIFPR